MEEGIRVRLVWPEDVSAGGLARHIVSYARVVPEERLADLDSGVGDQVRHLFQEAGGTIKCQTEELREKNGFVSSLIFEQH